LDIFSDKDQYSNIKTQSLLDLKLAIGEMHKSNKIYKFININ